MKREDIYNVNIVSRSLLPTPDEISSEQPPSEEDVDFVNASRQTLNNILDGKDKRLLVVVGPCSIHDYDSAMDYAKRLKKLSDKVSNEIFVVMRVYFEKPRTSIGWKGYINDPHLNDSFEIDEGLRKARKLLLDLARTGLPVGTEALDPVTPQYLHDLITWSAIGARTTESQTHREMASGLSTPVGIKNGTDGNIGVAINAMLSVSNPHHFLGVDRYGKCAVFQTRGNGYSHVVLRGGKQSNYDVKSISECEEKLREASLPVNIMVDCSHGNSNKDYRNQPDVFNACLEQIKNGNKSIFGLMVESHINEGNQKLSGDPQALKYGVSITDSCISWETTEKLLIDASEALR